MHPNFDMMPIELSTDLNSLRKLLHFASGRVPESWRIDVDVVVDTIFLTGGEENRARIITRSRESGHGHEFEKAFLKFEPGLEQSSGHHLIVRYSLGGMDCLVRFEVDGHVDDELVVDGSAASGASEKRNDNPRFDERSQALSGVYIQDLAAKSTSARAAEFKVVHNGSLVDDRTILELKSRAGSLKMQEIIPQLWISQTQNLFVGFRKDGLVMKEPDRFDMEAHFPAWESRNEERLSILGALLREIEDNAKKVKGGKCVLICKSEDKPRILKMYRRIRSNLFLPAGTREKCWGGQRKE